MARRHESLATTIAALLIVTSEFRYGTIHSRLLCEPRTRVVFGAQLAAAALAALVISVLATAVSLGARLAVLERRGVDVSLTTEHAITIVFGPIAAILAFVIAALLRASRADVEPR